MECGNLGFADSDPLTRGLLDKPASRMVRIRVLEDAAGVADADGLIRTF